ncbi:MAG: LptF/LptG family permease [Helicobacteraceae bacterium]|nr:LptF/LptG family permease [Helicobacteraceae bacterium]
MDSLRRYIIKNFSLLFFSIFMPLFVIASVVFLVKLATYTSVIQLSIFEMFKLYLFILPEIFFYTLPITFFIAATMSLFQLSTDNEMVVVFSLGIEPNFILKTLLRPALLLSVLMSFNFFVLFPHSTVLSTNLIRYKTSEAAFNLSASEFGHSFGNWLLYIGKANEDKTYSDVFLFNKSKEEEILISANKAEVLNDGGLLVLKLSDGEGYSYSQERFNQLEFETMKINNALKTDLRPYASSLEFWLSNDRRESKREMFITDTLLSIFPVLSLFLVMSIGIVNVRHQKAKIYLFLFLSIAAYYGLTIGLIKVLGFYNIPFVIFLTLLVSIPIYKKAILSRF